MIKKIIMYTDSGDSACADIEKYLKDQEVRFCVHDTTDKPLTYGELTGLIRYYNLNHFIERSAINGKKIPDEIPSSDREEIIEYIAEDNRLLRKPIILSGRLMTVGKNLNTIQDMLQIKTNGSDPDNGSKKRSKN